MRKLLPLILAVLLLLAACSPAEENSVPPIEEPTQGGEITQSPDTPEATLPPALTGEDVGAMVEEDFAYLWEVLSENYPFAAGMDAQAWNDEVAALKSHMEEMGFGFSAYQQNVGIMLMNTVPVRVNLTPVWLVEYQQMADGQAKGDTELLRQLSSYPLTQAFYRGLAEEYGEIEEQEVAQSKIETEMLMDGQVGYVRIPRFGGEEGNEDDRKQLMAFYNQLGDARSLVLDVRGNPGDCTASKWKDLLVAPLISQPSVSTSRTLVRGGDVSAQFNNSFQSYENITYAAASEADTSGIDANSISDAEYVKVTTNTIQPAEDAVNFTGKIYVLTDPTNRGQMDAFAQHASLSGFAELIGGATSGQGIGVDSAVYATLPVSGLLVRFTAETGLNPDGTSNLSGGIQPDLETGDRDALAACIEKIDPTADADEIARSVIPMNPIVTIEMADGGIITAELYPDIAPNTVANFVTLIQDGFYDGTIFHRVIPGFMIQGGDPQGTGMGGPDHAIKGEFAMNGFQNTLAHERGVLSMARSQMPDSAGSQFFIMHAAAPHLDGQYAAFGKVTDGLDVVDAIANSPTGANDRPNDPPTMKKVTVETGGVEYTVEKLPSTR